MLYTINQLYEHLYQKVNDIYDIFKGFFGEECVDLQNIYSEESDKIRIKNFLRTNGFDIDEHKTNDRYGLSDIQMSALESVFASTKVTIYVWWKNVTITNEHNRSIHIQDLYAKVVVQLDGRIPYEYIGFMLNRATYSTEQFLSSYLHSHIREIPKDNFTRFQEPCLGTGPIRDTIITLKSNYDEAEWMLFCQELSMYVTVESLTGGPWKRMENVGSTTVLCDYKDYNLSKTNMSAFLMVFDKGTLIKFIRYYLRKGHLSLSFKEGNFTPGLPYYEYIIDVSNSFIDFYNKELASDKPLLDRVFAKLLLRKVRVINNKFYRNAVDESPNTQSLNAYKDRLVLRFKGKEIRTTIFDPIKDNTEATITTVLDNGVAMYILKNILKVINYRYRNEHNNKTGGDQEASSTSQRVFYL